MNKRLIVYILGWVLIVEGAAMQIATVTSFIYGEHEGLYFLGVGALSALLGLLADYPEARRSAEYFPYESREPRSDCGQGCSENEKLRNDALRNLFRLDCT